MIDLLSLTTTGTVNSPFGLRKAPKAGASTRHNGIDITLKNPNIPAVLGGTVVNNAYNKYRGNYVTIRQLDGTTATYQHLAKPSPLAVGTSVKEGQIIGLQGSTGVSTGNHLHFEVSTAGGFLNPVDYMRGGKKGFSGTISTDGQGRPIGETLDEQSGVNDWFPSVKNALMGILGKLITFIVIVLIIVLAIVLFMKAFDVKLPI